jgi:hypothetical protein
VRVAEPFSIFPLGDADLSKVKEIFAGDYVKLGGIDQVSIL